MTNNNISTDQNSNSARIYGQSGALNDLLEKVDDPNILALEDILLFRKNYEVVRKKMVIDSIAQVKLEISKMISEMNQVTLERDDLIKSKSEELNKTISLLERKLEYTYQQNNFFTIFYSKIKRWLLNRKIKYFKENFQSILRNITKDHNKRIASLEIKIKFTENNLQIVAKDNISDELHRHDELSNKIAKEKYLIYGAIGEANVINELKKLPRTYHVINDFRTEFYPPIYNRTEDDRIYSIQVDHLVVGPTGIFIIETKNWSSKSISNEMLFSPVKQVKRAGFALFVLLNDAIQSRDIISLVNNWGERKISPKQTVVFVNSIPRVKFQFVKFIGIKKLNSYITDRKQEFTAEVIQDIIDYLFFIR